MQALALAGVWVELLEWQTTLLCRTDALALSTVEDLMGRALCRVQALTPTCLRVELLQGLARDTSALCHAVACDWVSHTVGPTRVLAIGTHTATLPTVKDLWSSTLSRVYALAFASVGIELLG